MPRKRTTTEKDIPKDRQIFRWWVEVRELRTGSVRELPLIGVRNIYIPRNKNDAGRPNKDVLELKDGSETREAKNLDDLAAQLRQRYPDEAYERRFFSLRDREAVKRRADAMEGLMQIIAEAVVEDLLRGSATPPARTRSP